MIANPPIALRFAVEGRTHWPALAVLIPGLTFLVVQAGLGIPTEAQRVPALFAVPAIAALGLLQARHSLAAARGTRPQYWPWTFAAILALVYVPQPWVSTSWAVAQWFVVGSGLLLLPRWLQPISVVGPVVFIVSIELGLEESITAGEVAWTIIYLSMVMAVGGIGIALAARLAHTLEELVRTRAELAARAVRRERLRVSRDLHDLLGHSLSAVSLKGELALRLLDRDPDAATREIHGLTAVAGDAVRGTHAVTFDEHRVAFADEVRGALTLLRAAGVDCRLDLDVGALGAETDRILAWAVREGVTNVLRHSEARWCSVAGARLGASVRLTIRNDGAGAADGAGRGLAGLIERAQALGGEVKASRSGDGNFTLELRVPRGDA